MQQKCSEFSSDRINTAWRIFLLVFLHFGIPENRETGPKWNPSGTLEKTENRYPWPYKNRKAGTRNLSGTLEIVWV